MHVSRSLSGKSPCRFRPRLTTVQPGNDPPKTSIRSHLVDSRPPTRVQALRKPVTNRSRERPHILRHWPYYIPPGRDTQLRKVPGAIDRARSYRALAAELIAILCILLLAACGSCIGGEMPRTFDVLAPFGLSGSPSRVVAAHTHHRTAYAPTGTRFVGRTAACQEGFPSD